MKPKGRGGATPAVSVEDHFIDLGSGSGRLALKMRLLTNVGCSEGVELSHTRHNQAEAARADGEANQPQRALAAWLACSVAAAPGGGEELDALRVVFGAFGLPAGGEPSIFRGPTVLVV